MGAFFKINCKKNKKLRPDAERFSREIDEDVRDLLINEFLNNICRRYMRLRTTLHAEAGKIIQDLND